MRFTVGLVGEFSVRANGAELQPPPDRTVAVLLLGLLDGADRWVSRSQVAGLLYPEVSTPAALNALRQTLFRFRKWLGPEVVQSQNNSIRLAPGLCEATWEDLDSLTGSTLAGIAPGLQHPWADAIRARRAKPRPDSAKTLHADFVRAVASAAGVDKDAARKILIGGSEIAVNLRSEEAAWLLGLTQPTDRRNPLAYEHLALRGFLHAKSGALRLSTEAYVKAYRLACHQRVQSKMAQAAAMAMFMFIECGDMGEAAIWLDRFTVTDRTAPVRLLLANARAAYLWNLNRVQEAAEIMTAAIPLVQAADRAQSVHFWTNLSVLAAEAADVEMQVHADEAARTLAVPAIDVWSIINLEFASATRLMAKGVLDQAIESFKHLKAKAAAAGQQAACWYILEAHAEALAHAGHIRQAVEMWSQAESERRAASARLTPRLAARKSRIMRYA